MRFGLERMRRLLTALGSPQAAFRAIHVVGTNGKSSTTRFAAAMLEAQGVRAGAYLSPHLTTFAERIRIGDADLAPDAFGAAVERVGRGGAQGRARTRGRRACDAVRAADRGRVRRAGRGRGARWRRSRPGWAGAGTPRTCSTRRSSCSPTSAWSTRAGSARRCPTSRAEKLAVVRAGATLVLGERDPDVVALAEATGARVLPVSDAARRVPAPLSASQRRARAHGGRGAAGIGRRGCGARGGGERRRTRPLPAPAGRPADDRRRRPQPGRHGRAGRGAARRRRRPAADRLRVDPRRQGRGRHAAQPAAPVRGRGVHRLGQSALAPAGHPGVAGRAARRLRRSRDGARRRPGAGARAALAGPDGAVVATGSIYLVADLLTAAGVRGGRRASAL